MRLFRSAKRLAGQSTEGIPRPAGYRWRGTWQELAWRQRVRIGLPLALGCAWLARPTAPALVGGAGVSFVGVLVRARTAGHLRKNAALTTSGPYAFTRHPLYLGSGLLAAGLLIAGRSLVADALGVAYFALFYGAAIGREERRLRRRFGAAFEAYAARVPRFLPRLGRAGGGGPPPFSWRLYWRNGEWQTAVGFAAGVLLLWLDLRWRG